MSLWSQLIAFQMRWSIFCAFDTALLSVAAAHRSDILDQLFRGITWLGSLYVLIPSAIALVCLLAYRRYRLEAILLTVGLSGATLLAHISKQILARPRPELYPPLIEIPVSYSFPSAHVTQATAFFLCLFLVVRRTSPDWKFPVACTAVLLVTCVAVSRVYLQVHFPSDTLAGLFLGVLWVSAIYKLMLRRGQ